jgi:alanine racemase
MFDDIRNRFLKAGFQPVCHISASPSVMRFGKEWIGEGDLVRVGALLYGIYPAPGMEEEFAATFPLKPILSWKTILTELKRIPAGSSVGYNRSETVVRDTLMGICPVGYWHGFPGVLSSKGIVMIGGQQAKVLGRVSMDVLVVDCTDCVDAKVGDEVTLIDSDPQSPVSAQRVADMAQMSVHEFLTRLNSRIMRVFL